MVKKKYVAVQMDLVTFVNDVVTLSMTDGETFNAQSYGWWGDFEGGAQ